MASAAALFANVNAMAVRLIPVYLIAAWTVVLGGIVVLPNVVALDDRGDFLIRNTVRLALLYWAIAVSLMLGPRFASGWTARLAWTLGCMAYLVHVGLAFEYAHHWSHAKAFAHVKQAGGVGAGIFASYFFTILWTLDAAWWWIDRTSYQRRPRWLGCSIHGFMVFMIANGAVVFENGPIRWIGAAVLLGLGGLFWRRMDAYRQAASG